MQHESDMHERPHLDPRQTNAERPVLRAEDCGASPAATTWRPLVRPTMYVRGVAGDELPWRIAGSVKGKLTETGHLKIRVRGLVFTDDSEVPVELRGKNDEARPAWPRSSSSWPAARTSGSP